MSAEDILLEAEMAMEKSVDYMIHEFSSVRTGKASPALVENIEKALKESKIGIMPLVDGKVIRLPVPELSEERRKDLVKSLKQMAEEARVRVRSNRRTAMEDAKKMEKNGEATEDQLRDMEGDIQKLTDRFVKSIDEHLERKDAEVMKV